MILHAPEEVAVYHPKLLYPYLTQDINGRELPQKSGLLVSFNSIHEPKPVLSDLLRISQTLWFGVRQAIIIGSGTVPSCPLRLEMAG